MSVVKPPAPRLRFLLAWGGYSKGAIITPPGVLRDHLMAVRWYGHRVVELVQSEVTLPPAVTLPPLSLTESIPESETIPVHHDRKRKRGRS